MKSRRRVNSTVMFLLAQLLMFGALSSTQGARLREATCDQELLSRADSSFRRRDKRRGLRTLEQAQADINDVLESCPLVRGRSRFERRLQIVHEEIALVNLQLADFYLHAGLEKGALARLIMIDEHYPRFSQMDRVVFLLGDLSD